MDAYAIITNRKRAVIALIHSFFFLALALRTLASSPEAKAIWLASGSSAIVMLVVYSIVSAILIQLVRVSRCSRERLYFAFCASSATLGLLRAVFGDPGPHIGQYLRVVMLICAVVTGTAILRGHSRVALAIEEEA